MPFFLPPRYAWCSCNSLVVVGLATTYYIHSSYKAWFNFKIHVVTTFSPMSDVYIICIKFI
jgi:hypothetical protein